MKNNLQEQINHFRNTINETKDFYIVGKNEFDTQLFDSLDLIKEYVPEGYTFREIDENTFSVTVHKKKIFEWLDRLEKCMIA